MSGYLYNLVGNVLKYFKEKRAFLTNEAGPQCCTPSRGNQRKLESPDDHDIWMTPDCFSKRHKSGMGESRMFYNLHGAGDYLYPLEYSSWPEFPDESSHSLRLLAPPTRRAPARSCLKRSYSADLNPPPLLHRHRTEWKSSFDNIFPSQPSSAVEEPKRSLSSRIPQQSFRAADDCVLRSVAAQPNKSPCTCSRRNAERQTVARRSQLNAQLERMFRLVSKRKYCGNIIDAASHARWMKLAGVGHDDDAANFKKFAKGRVVLTVSQYKSALKKICEDNSLDYWNVLDRMTEVPIEICDSNCHVSTQSLN